MREWPPRRPRRFRTRHLQAVRDEAVSVVDANTVHPERVRQRAAADPVGAALMAEFIEALSTTPFVRSQVMCAVRGEELLGLCLMAGNLVPLGLPPEAYGPVAEHVRRRGLRFSSMVGSAEEVMALWRLLRRHLGSARDIRPDQPSLMIDYDPLIEADPQVRPGRVEDLDILIPACVAMFTEEVGYSPLSAGGGYERRIRNLVEQGRSLVRIGSGPAGPEVVFKAEIGTVGLGAAQIQGVWVNPRHRGKGLAAPGMAAVVEHTRARFAPIVSLYVNSYNTAALATYSRVGFRQVGTFATILL